MHRSLRISLAVIALILSAAVSQSGPVNAGTLRADLDGSPIPISEIASYHCHDLAYPIIHCFSSESALVSSAFDEQNPRGHGT